MMRSLLALSTKKVRLHWRERGDGGTVPDWATGEEFQAKIRKLLEGLSEPPRAG